MPPRRRRRWPPLFSTRRRAPPLRRVPAGGASSAGEPLENEEKSHMSRLPTIDPAAADAAAKHLLARTEAQLGRLPNLYRTMANAPAALEGYLALRAALVRGRLGDVMREKLAVLVAEENSCEYCVS